MILKQIKCWIKSLIEQLDAMKTQKRKIEIQIKNIYKDREREMQTMLERGEEIMMVERKKK